MAERTRRALGWHGASRKGGSSKKRTRQKTNHQKASIQTFSTVLAVFRSFWANERQIFLVHLATNSIPILSQTQGLKSSNSAYFAPTHKTVTV